MMVTTEVEITDVLNFYLIIISEIKMCWVLNVRINFLLLSQF